MFWQKQANGETLDPSFSVCLSLCLLAFCFSFFPSLSFPLWPVSSEHRIRIGGSGWAGPVMGGGVVCGWCALPRRARPSDWPGRALTIEHPCWLADHCPHWASETWRSHSLPRSPTCSHRCFLPCTGILHRRHRRVHSHSPPPTPANHLQTSNHHGSI